MRSFIILILFTVGAVAKPPECPIFKNKRECLQYVAENYENYLDFIKPQDPFDQPADEDPLLLAAADIKHFETLACEKTCLN